MFILQKHWCAGLVLIGVAFFADLASAGRESGLQVTPDGKRTLISKDVGDERWAITLNADDGSITGNVFRRDGGAPQFIWCGQTGSTAVDLVFVCKGAGACASGACSSDSWVALQQVTIPRSFVSPPAAQGAALGEVAHDVATPADEGRASGLQQTPDGRLRTLINKDVGGERWAITRHTGDRTVTGNVFSDVSGSTTFLFCEEKIGNAPGALTLSCSAASACTAAPCTREQWTFVAEVTIPLDFIGLATCTDVSGSWRYSEQGTLECTSRYADIDDSFPFGGKGSATIQQNGCALAIAVTGGGVSWTMRGTVTGDTISVSGPADILLEDGELQLPPGVSVGGTWTWNGSADRGDFDLESSGSISARYAGRTILSCSVEGTHAFRR